MTAAVTVPPTNPDSPNAVRRLRHMPGTDGASLVKTPMYLLTEQALKGLTGRNGVVAIDGPAGHGKTFAVDAVANALGRTVYWLDLDGSPNMRAMYARLYHSITGVWSDARAYRIQDEIQTLLSQQDCLLVIDEAQWSNRMLLRVARSTYDQVNHSGVTGQHFGLVLVGQRLDRAFDEKDSGLRSRISRRVRAKPLDVRTIGSTLSRYHAMYANTAPTVISQVLWPAARGNWRDWAHVLETALSMGIDLDDGISQKAAKQILAVTGIQPPTPPPSKQKAGSK